MKTFQMMHARTRSAERQQAKRTIFECLLFSYLRIDRAKKSGADLRAKRTFFFYYYPSLYTYNVLGGSVNNRATIPLYIKFELCYRKSVAKRLNEKKSNSNINKYKQSVHIMYTFAFVYTCMYVCIYICIHCI